QPLPHPRRTHAGFCSNHQRAVNRARTSVILLTVAWVSNPCIGSAIAFVMHGLKTHATLKGNNFFASMKYAIIIPDGAADEPIPQLGNKTPFEAASIPNMD